MSANDSRGSLNKIVEVAEVSVRGGLFLFTGSTVATFVLALASIIIARLLGPDSYGLYSVSLIVPGFLLLFADFGVNSALIKYLAQFRVEGEKARVASLIRNGFLFKLSVGCLLFLVSFVFSDFFALYVLKRPGIGFFIRLVSLLIICQILFNTTKSVFVGLDRMELSAATSVTESVVKVVLAPLLIVLGFGIMGALVGHMVSYVVAGLLGVLIVYRIYREHSNPGLKFNFFEDLRFMFRFGVPLYSSVLLLSFLGQFRSMVLAWFTSDFEIGNYMVASNFLSLLSVLAIPISTALFPAFSKFDLNKERGELRKFFRYSLKYILLVIVPASMLVALISKDLVYFLYGVKYSLAPFFLTLLVLTYLYIGFSLVVSSFFNGIGRTEISFRISLMNCFVGVPLGLVLTMFYGVPGLIVSMIISGVTSLAYALRVAVCRFGMSFDVKSVVKIYLAAFLSAIPVFVVVTYFSLFGCLVNLFLAVMIFVGFYLVLVPVMGAIKEEDIDNLRNIFGKIKMLAPFIDVLLRFEHMVLKLCGYCS